MNSIDCYLCSWSFENLSSTTLILSLTRQLLFQHHDQLFQQRFQLATLMMWREVQSEVVLFQFLMICFIFWFKSTLFISVFMCSSAKSFINIYSWFSSSMFIWTLSSWKSFKFESHSAVSWSRQMSCIKSHDDDSDDDDNFRQRIFCNQLCKRTWQWWRWHSSSLMLFIFISHEEHTCCIICKSSISVFI